MTLPPAFLQRPLAHRGLHDPKAGRLENCLAAFDAASGSGYGIECDVRLARDGTAVVFHDATLDRLSGAPGSVADLTAAELSVRPLLNTADRIGTLSDILGCIPSATPVLVEMKSNGVDHGRLAEAVASAVTGRRNVAVMSFDPACVSDFARMAPQTPCGLTTPVVGGDVIVDCETSGACFVAHDRADLDHPALDRLRRGGAAILSWTIRTPMQERAARAVADTIIFEGYRPVIGA